MKKYLIASFLFLFLWMPGLVSAADNPVNILSSVADQMITQLKSHKATLKTNPTLVYALTNKIVVPHANLDAMSQRVLPPQTWKQASTEQRNEFKKQFTHVLERTYASALANYTDESVRFYPVRGGFQGKSSVIVNSEIVRNDGPSIRVNYRLVVSNGQWKLYDMTVEGVSMLESFRSQFADKLAQGNMADLNATLRKHNASHG